MSPSNFIVDARDVEDAMIPWLVEAADRLRLYHVEIEAALRRVAWGEQLSHEHVTALFEVMCQAAKINTAVIKHLSDKRQRIAELNTAGHVQRSLASIQRTASRNGKHLNGKGLNGASPVMLKY
jgi:hypothetical protein